jgi:uncharacterized membrane protein YfcA
MDWTMTAMSGWPVALSLATLVFGGLSAGLLGGYLGLGGGIIVMPLLRFGLGMPPALAAGTCIVAVLFTTLGGTVRHARLGNIHVPSVLPVLLPGAVAAGLASLLFHALARTRWLDLGLGLVFAAIAGRMLLEAARALRSGVAEGADSGVVGGRPLPKVLVGLAGGILPGLLGIGTGGILVPSFAFGFRASMKTAAAASLACFCCNALISAGFKLSLDCVVLSVALPVSLGALLGAALGAGLANGSRSRTLQLLFGMVFCYVALKFILESTEVLH